MKSYLSLLAASSGLAVLLHHLEKRYPIKPDKVWMEVAAGVALTLLWSRWYAQNKMKSGHAITWRDYDTCIWSAFIVSSVPQIVWQEWLTLDKTERKAEHHG